jgi:FtsP/CotA-like multicopper oxidase with cupredoxin domain
MPDGQVVPMWGYASANSDFSVVGPATSPGPMITVPDADGTLTIHLQNQLAADPVSIMIAGQALPTSVTIDGGPVTVEPVRHVGGPYDGRVRSFLPETPPGSIGVYTFENLRHGSYIYQSGTHIAVQVQMGLYGAVKKDFAPFTAYDGVTYNDEVIMFYSEVDPSLHLAVYYDYYGTPDYPNTLNYDPRYYLINGDPYNVLLEPALATGNVGDEVIIRFFNAGLRDHIPVLEGEYFNLVAEDGNQLPYTREQYSVLMTAGKTMDAIFVRPGGGPFPIYDRVALPMAAPQADLNQDGLVDATDLTIMINFINGHLTIFSEYAQYHADMNHDGTVNQNDLNILSILMAN